MVRVTPSLAAKIGKGLATPAAPSTTTTGKAKDFFREVCHHSETYRSLLVYVPQALVKLGSRCRSVGYFLGPSTTTS